MAQELSIKRGDDLVRNLTFVQLVDGIRQPLILTGARLFFSVVQTTGSKRTLVREPVAITDAIGGKAQINVSRVVTARLPVENLNWELQLIDTADIARTVASGKLVVS